MDYPKLIMLIQPVSPESKTTSVEASEAQEIAEWSTFCHLGPPAAQTSATDTHSICKRQQYSDEELHKIGLLPNHPFQWEFPS